MADFSLENFLATYKPKEKLDLSYYLDLTVLKDYDMIINKDYGMLIPLKTYIKYIRSGYEKIKSECSDEDVVDGGVLLAGGYYLNGQFIESDDKKLWSYLKLDTNINKNTKQKQRYFSYIIKLTK